MDVIKKDKINNPAANHHKPSFQYLNSSSCWFMIFSLTILCAPALPAQEEAFLETREETVLKETERESEEEEEEPLTVPKQRLEMEIRSSTLGELAAWCRSLGLSEGGTRDDLSKRLREHFEIREPRPRGSGKKIITIESAQTSEYFSIDVIGEDYARLKGDVKLSLIDGDTVHKIRAEEILFNRTRNIITAKGKVIYEKIETDKTETFRGENITVDIDSWASVFLEGNTERKLDSDGTSYLFSGSLISRTEQDTTILENASISSAGNEEALWSINASKIWLLPGSDFAIFNALLKVGEIPVLYIPFFYFPGDDPVFHPVLGYRSREGAFIQTTTYLLGQPKTETSESSLSRILGDSSDKEKRIEGLFLRSTGKKITDMNSPSLKLLADYYVNLGAYFGIDLLLPKRGALDPLDFKLGIGLTRTITESGGGNYTPYTPNEDGIYDGSFDWNHSYLFTESVPFRYLFKFQSSVKGRLGSLSWNFPFYSDPYIETDFSTRSEKMDFMNMIQQGAAFGTDEITSSQISSYQWLLNGTFNPSLQSLAPYVSRFSITSFSTSLLFRSIQDKSIPQGKRDPQRLFYAPDKYTIYNVSGALSGTPLTIGGTETKAGNKTAEQINNPLDGIGVPFSPWEDDTEEQKEKKSSAGSRTSIDTITPPVITQTFSLPRAGDVKFNMDYSVTPTSSTELQFMTNKWQTYDDVDWNAAQSILTSVGGSSNINLRSDHTTGLFSNTVTFSGNGTWRDYNFLNEEFYRRNDGTIDENRMNEARRHEYSQTNYQTFYAYNGTLRPFYQDNIFSQTNFQYNFRGTLVRSRRYLAANSPDGPDLTPEWGSWVKEERKDGIDIYGLSAHRFSTNIAANVMDKTQNVSVSMDLPPLDELIITNASFRVWISETNINFRVERPVTDNENNEWKFKPVYLTETLRFAKVGSFSFYMVIDPEQDNEITTITSSLTLWNFKAAYSAQKVAESVFMEQGGWQSQGDPILLPKELSFTYASSIADRNIFDKRANLSLRIDTGLTFDLQRHTNSAFRLTTGLTLKIPSFLELTLSASMRNLAIWRYFKEVPGFEDLTFMYLDGPQNNVFLDLFDSFNFADDSKRRRSGFKIQRFQLKAVHFLGDWNAELDVNMYPWRDTQSPTSVFNIIADISFSLKWKPITEIKSEIDLDGKTDKWTIKQ